MPQRCGIIERRCVPVPFFCTLKLSFFFSFWFSLLRLLIVYGPFLYFSFICSFALYIFDTISPHWDLCVQRYTISKVWDNRMLFDIVVVAIILFATDTHRHQTYINTHPVCDWHILGYIACVFKYLCISRSVQRYYLIYCPVESSIRNASEFLCFVRCGFFSDVQLYDVRKYVCACLDAGRMFAWF